MTLSDWTKIIILATGVIWIAWDIFVYRKQGNLPTESWTIKKWSYYMPGIAFLLGILMGHFFFTFTPPQGLCPSGPVNIQKGVSK